jgi:FAD synthase
VLPPVFREGLLNGRIARGPVRRVSTKSRSRPVSASVTIGVFDVSHARHQHNLPETTKRQSLAAKPE